MKFKSFFLRIDERYSGDDEAEINRFLEGKEVKRIRTGLVEGEIPRWSILFFYEEYEMDEKGELVKDEPIKLDESETELYELLRGWRKETAAKTGLSPFMILHNGTLKAIAKSAPTSVDTLASIKGIGPKKIEDYGEGVLEIVSRFVNR